MTKWFINKINKHMESRTEVQFWLGKHGNLDLSNPSIHSMKYSNSKETPVQKIKRLEKELADEKLRIKILKGQA